MGLLAEVKTWWISHLLLFYIVLVSGLIANFLMLLTFIFVWPFNKSLYRKIVIHLGYSWWSQFTFLTQWYAGSKCTMFYENPEDLKYNGNEHSIVIMNHKYETEFLMCWTLAERFGLLGFTFLAQWWAESECILCLEKPEDYDLIGKEHNITIMNHKYDIDWLMAWILAERLQMLGGTKIYGKRSLQLVPLVGWAWTFTESIFLKRDWEKDRRTIVKDLDYITAYPKDYWVTLLLFAEGTRFTEAKHEASMEVARQKGLPELKHHLLPRTKGFVLTMEGVKGKMHSILDLTIGFTSDGAEPHFWNVVNGKPVNAQIYCRRIPLENVNTESDEACAEWLHQLYREKDEIYDNFHKNGTYTIGTKLVVPRRYHDLIMWIFWAIVCCVPMFYYLAHVFISGSLYTQIGVVAFCFGLYAAARKMMDITQIVRGSKYGKQKSVEEDKKTN